MCLVVTRGQEHSGFAKTMQIQACYVLVAEPIQITDHGAAMLSWMADKAVVVTFAARW